MLRLFGRRRSFVRSERGIVTVEWVVIAVVVMIAALAITVAVLNGASDLGSSVANKMSDAADEMEED